MSTAVDAVVAQAIEWLVQQHSGEMTAEQQVAFLRWRAAHPSHENACLRLERTLGGLSEVGREPDVRRQLDRPRSRRKILQGGMALLAVASTAGILQNRHASLAGVFADLGTTTAQRAEHSLSEGSRLYLNARTSVDLRLDAGYRRINLQRGRLYIEATAASQPLVIATHDGRVSLDQGRIALSFGEQGTRLAVDAQVARVWDNQGASFDISGKSGCLLGNSGAMPLPLSVERESAWRRGVFEVDDQPLAVLLEALRDYRPGILRASPDAAALRISGIFALDDTDYTLNSLVQTLPLSMTRTTRYWVSLARV